MEITPVAGEEKESILATCTAANAKPPAEIQWRTGRIGQPVTTSTNTTLNADSTTTVRVDLRGEPSRDINQKEAQCVVNHVTLSQERVVPYKLDVLCKFCH